MMLIMAMTTVMVMVMVLVMVMVMAMTTVMVMVTVPAIMMTVKHRSERIDVTLNTDQADATRDALAKAIYFRFDNVDNTDYLVV